MNRLMKLLLSAVFLVFLAAAGPIACAPATSGSGGCCRYCSTGKPCGDSCISRSSTCHVGAGCACWAYQLDGEDEFASEPIEIAELPFLALN